MVQDANPQHRHDEFHRGVVPEDQLATGTAAAGQVPVATGTGSAAWTSASGVSATPTWSRVFLVMGA